MTVVAPETACPSSPRGPAPTALLLRVLLAVFAVVIGKGKLTFEWLAARVALNPNTLEP